MTHTPPMSASPLAPGEGEPQACCAHIRVIYRTQDYQLTEADITAMGPPPPNPIYPPLRVGHTVTRGWWECDSGCGTRFEPSRARLPQADADAPTTDGERWLFARRALSGAGLLPDETYAQRDARLDGLAAHLAKHLSSRVPLPGVEPEGATADDSERLRQRLAGLRAERLEIAALLGIEPCDDDRPHSWTFEDRGSVHLVDMVKLAVSSRPAAPGDAALAEPVAWAMRMADGRYRDICIARPKAPVEEAASFDELYPDGAPHTVVPLYAHPTPVGTPGAPSHD